MNLLNNFLFKITKTFLFLRKASTPHFEQASTATSTTEMFSTTISSPNNTTTKVFDTTFSTKTTAPSNKTTLRPFTTNFPSKALLNLNALFKLNITFDFNIQFLASFNVSALN